MGERHSNVPSTRWVIPTAVMVCLAGTATSLGQAGKPPARPATPGAGGSAARPVIHQAGAKPQQGQPGADAGKVKVDDHLIVDLHVNDEDLLSVLQMLSIQSQKNIVTSKNVAANITANLYGVTLYEALDAILNVNGYGYIERNNFIYVYTMDELVAIQNAQRQAVWKVLKLNYLNATDAAEFVKPLLSDKGQIKTNGKAPNFTISETVPSGSEDFANESTLLVFDYEENLGEIEKVLQQMDTRPQQVLVEATILQTTLNEANAFGVDFSIIGDLDFQDFVNLGGPLKAVDGLIGGSSSSSSGSSSGSGSDSGSGSGSGSGGSSAGTPLPADGSGRAIVSTAGNTAGPGTMKLGIVQNDVAAFVRLLDEVSDTTIISRPNLLALNRVPARVLVGRKVGYLNSTSTDTATTQTVEFLETGTQLYFRPFISADGMIRMELKPKVSEAVIRNVTNTGGAAVTIPDEISNELTTNVLVRDGQTIVLGGLFRESTQANRRQVPGIGDIPILGAAFRGHEDNTQRSEIIFLITPTIMSDTVLLEQGKRGLAMVEQVRSGSREGLLPFSREKRTQQLVMQADELARQGKREEALYKVQRALRLNHNQADAVALRETLIGKRDLWPTRSLQDEIIHQEQQKWLESLPPAAPKGVRAQRHKTAPVAQTTGGDSSSLMTPTGHAASAGVSGSTSATATSPAAAPAEGSASAANTSAFGSAAPNSPVNPSEPATATPSNASAQTAASTPSGPAAGDSGEPFESGKADAPAVADNGTPSDATTGINPWSGTPAGSAEQNQGASTGPVASGFTPTTPASANESAQNPESATAAAGNPGAFSPSTGNPSSANPSSANPNSANPSTFSPTASSASPFSPTATGPNTTNAGTAGFPSTGLNGVASTQSPAGSGEESSAFGSTAAPTSNAAGAEGSNEPANGFAQNTDAGNDPDNDPSNAASEPSAAAPGGFFAWALRAQVNSGAAQQGAAADSGPAASTQEAAATPAAPAPAPEADPMESPARFGHAEGVRSFKGVWDLLQLYASHRTAFTSVPETPSSPSIDGK
jgi:type II secretory pathway component GspD/PulD (secretin)